MKTILLGLNELNFQYIKYYIKKGHLKNFNILFNNGIIETESESKYDLLEPWIQWVTVHTGMTFDEHQVFHLGDITKRKDLMQIFEELESKGKIIGAVSPFNVDNRLSNAAFFVPDPWTVTHTSGDVLLKVLSQTISKLVNNNASGKLSVGNIPELLLGVLKYVPLTRYTHYLSLALKIKKAGVKAVILDSLLSDVTISLLKKKKLDFCNLFLNSGAHIQHHYLFNSAPYEGPLKNPSWYCSDNWDPLFLILKEYDNTIGRLLDLKDIKLIAATGLHQQAHKHQTYYWRLKNHTQFLKEIDCSFSRVIPRMSRDFLIEFSNIEEAKNCQNILESYKMQNNDEGVFKVDNKGESLFVELVYSNPIDENDKIYSNIDENKEVNNFKSHLAFVAIKNGEHNGLGYLTSNFNLNLGKKIQLAEVNSLLKRTVLES